MLIRHHGSLFFVVSCRGTLLLLLILHMWLGDNPRLTQERLKIRAENWKH